MAVPKLRFKDSEGREFPEWEEKKLGDFTERIKRKAPENSIAPVMMIAAESGFIYQKDRYSRENAGKSLTNYTLLKQEEFSYNHGYSKLRNYGSVFILKEPEARVPFVYHSFKLLSGVGDFWGYYLNSGLLDRTLKKTISSTARMDGLLNISYEAYMDINVRVPSLPEQQKIADFLTAYDTMIDTQSQRVEAMRTRKKGLLQKIFSQEIRFKNDNGQNYPEWEKKTVGSLANNIVGGGTPSTKNPAFYAGEIPWISSSDLVEDKINYLNMTRFITQDAINRSATKLIPAQSVMIVCRVGVGKVAVNELPLCTSQDFMNLIVKEENSPVFIGYLLMNLMVKRKNSVQGTAIKGIPSAEIKKFKVLVPALPEQQKIADFLTTVDAQIDVEEKRLETMKTIKKGLLQQMFI